MPKPRAEHEISKNPYRDENDPRHRAVEIRREYERNGYDVVNGVGVFDPETRRNVTRGQPEKPQDRRR